jgi:hypothetical protein
VVTWPRTIPAAGGLRFDEQEGDALRSYQSRQRPGEADLRSGMPEVSRREFLAERVAALERNFARYVAAYDDSVRSAPTSSIPSLIRYRPEHQMAFPTRHPERVPPGLVVQGLGAPARFQ